MIGKENVYVCGTCQGMIRTVDKDIGVTPMFLMCSVDRAGREGCKGLMMSRMYRLALFPTAHPSWPSKVTHEWYKPEAEEFNTLSQETQQHVMRGGLLIRRITP